MYLFNSILFMSLCVSVYYQYRQRRFIKLQRQFINDLLDIEQVEIICRDLDKKTELEVRH